MHILEVIISFVSSWQVSWILAFFPCEHLIPGFMCYKQLLVSDQLLLVSDQLLLVSDQLLLEWSVPTGEWSVPTVEWSAPPGEWSAPTVEWSAPPGEWSVPTGEWSAPPGEWSVPTGEWSAPHIVYYSYLPVWYHWVPAAPSQTGCSSQSSVYSGTPDNTKTTKYHTLYNFNVVVNKMFLYSLWPHL